MSPLPPDRPARTTRPGNPAAAVAAGCLALIVVARVAGWAVYPSRRARVRDIWETVLAVATRDREAMLFACGAFTVLGLLFGVIAIVAMPGPGRRALPSAP